MTQIAILLPTYNGARYLREQVESIRRQTHADWRLFVADDGSSDDTVPILHGLARQDARIVVLPTTGNLGQKRRLRQLAAAPDAELVAISDQDDVWQADKLERLADALGDADMAFGASHLIDAGGRDLGRLLTDNLPPRYLPGERLGLLFRPWVSAHAMLARRHLLNPGNFDRWLPFDWLMSMEAAFGRGLVYAPEAVTRHRMHDSNQANGEFAEQRPRQRLVSRGMTRVVRRARDAERGHFMRVAERMHHAEGAPEDVRRRFGEALAVCDDAWFGRWHEPRSTPGETLARLTALLKPLAGHPQDWGHAELRLRALCLAPYVPARVLNRYRLLRHERER